MKSLRKRISELERRVPKYKLRKFQKEGDLREYSDEEYIDFLEGYLCIPQIINEQQVESV